MEKRFLCDYCNLEFTEPIRLERHVKKAHSNKGHFRYRDHDWYAAGAASGYV